jgi:hypothetical protein
MTATVLVVLRRAMDGIDGDRFTPPVTMLAVGVAGVGAAPSLFRTPVGTLTAMVALVAGVRLALLPFGEASPRPSIPRLLFSALATAVSRVLTVLGVSAQIALLWLLTGILWTRDGDDMSYPGQTFTAAFSYAMALTGTLLALLALCWLVITVALPAKRTPRPTDHVTAPPAGVAVIAHAGRAVPEERPRVTAVGALDRLGDDPGLRAAAREILDAVTPPEDRR